MKFFGTFSNIVTRHAEDGSGVGSAIIAGKWTFYETFVEPII